MLTDVVVHRNALGFELINELVAKGQKPTGETMDCLYDDGTYLPNRIIRKDLGAAYGGILDLGDHYLVSYGDELYRVEKNIDLDITPIES